MPEPRDFQILQNLQAALQTIATRNGYYYDVTQFAVKLDPNVDVESLLLPDGPRPFLLVEVLSDTPDYDPDLQYKVVLRIRVHWVGETDATDDAARLRTYLRACADVERAVAADPGRGGLANDTRITRRSYDTAVDGSQVWAINDLDIRLERTYGAP